MLNGKKLAITTGSMNRLGNLQKSLATWLRLPEPDYIIVVDWSSANPIFSTLQELKDPRLIVAEAPEQPKWHHSKCHNLEFKIAQTLGCEFVLRLDNDYLVQPDFFTKHPITSDAFYTVDCHLVPPEADDKRNLCGTLFTTIDNFLKVGGYNERLVHYGYEDEDLYLRMQLSGLQWKNCDLSTLDHIPHDDLTRFENLDIDMRKFRDVSKLKQYMIAKNLHSSSTKPWTLSDRAAQWTIAQTNRHWKCLELKDST
jgi:hypothetical protein